MSLESHVHSDLFDDETHREKLISDLNSTFAAVLASQQTLTRDQECCLFTGMNLLKCRVYHNVCTEESDRQDCARRLNHVRDYLILKNRPLMLDRLGRHLGVRPHYAQHRDDLISVGDEALIKAVDSFDFQRGVRFSTYAVPKIDGSFINWSPPEACHTGDVSDAEAVVTEPRLCGTIEIADELTSVLQSALPAICMRVYSEFARRRVLRQLRLALRTHYQGDSVYANLNALALIAGISRETAGRQIGEYIEPISRLAVEARDQSLGVQAQNKASQRLRELIEPVGTGIAAAFEMTDKVGHLIDHLVAAACCHLDEETDNRFCDLLPVWVQDFFQQQDRVVGGCLWQWASPPSLKQLQTRTPVNAFLEAHHAKVDNWQIVYECCERDLLSFGEALGISIALFTDPGSWELPEPAEAKNRMFLACMNAVHSIDSSSASQQRIPRVPSDDFYAVARSDTYWADALEFSLGLLQKGFIGTQLKHLGVLQEE